MIAALYIDRRGPYWNRPDIDAWDVERDARKYDGPWPVVAHPPCERWGRYWSGGPSARERRKLGDDGGCFEAALAAVRKWGGVLEHPEASHAFQIFNLPVPPKTGGWINLIGPLRFVCTSCGDRMASYCEFEEYQHDGCGGLVKKLTEWVCCVEQGHYGHPARKATWLYYVGDNPPSLRWGRSSGVRLDEGFHSKAERDAARAAGKEPVKRLSSVQNIVTPPAFAELLLGLARNARVSERAA